MEKSSIKEYVVPVDMLGKPIKPGQLVIFTNNIYRVLEAGTAKFGSHGYIRMILNDPSPSTKPVKKYSRDIYVIPEEDVIVWKLKNGK